MSKKNKNKKVIWIVGIIILLSLIGFWTWVIVDANVQPKITVEDNVITIKDTYSRSISLVNADIILSENPIVLQKRVSGTAIKNLRKGRFLIEGNDEEVYLSMMNINAKYILIVKNDKQYYINRKTEQETIDLYYELIRVDE